MDLTDLEDLVDTKHSCFCEFILIYTLDVIDYMVYIMDSFDDIFLKCVVVVLKFDHFFGMRYVGGVNLFFF